MTPDDLDAHVRGLGYTVEIIHDTNGNAYPVVRDVTIPTGSLAGRVCDVAIQRPTAVPYVTPAAIQTRPALVPMGSHTTQASPLGAEWQYWSRRLDRPPMPQVIWAHILTIFAEV